MKKPSSSHGAKTCLILTSWQNRYQGITTSFVTITRSLHVLLAESSHVGQRIEAYELRYGKATMTSWGHDVE